jgi:hypothetical protein
MKTLEQGWTPPDGSDENELASDNAVILPQISPHSAAVGCAESTYRPSPISIKQIVLDRYDDHA